MPTMQTGWRAWLASLLGTRGHAGDAPPHLSKPFLRRRGRTLELQFAHGTSQSQMMVADPDRLLIDYTRTMLGAMVLARGVSCIGMVGLGGGSQAKYCHRHLPATRVEVVENNPHVLALRRRFRIPRDDARLQVFLDDGARFLAQRPARYDLLLVDGYDETGIPEALSTQAFYDDCRAALAPGGAMATNLYCGDSARHLERLEHAFGRGRVLVLDEPRQSNRVAFAWTGDVPEGNELPSMPPFVARDLAPVFAKVRAVLAARMDAA